jgi:hypothetical protein
VVSPTQPFDTPARRMTDRVIGIGLYIGWLMGRGSELGRVNGKGVVVS